ncbi:MAG TPA: VOC family protein [Acidobacteriota bacterium]|nr:VOC family protein [Acidobacteriota bacterium]
MIKKMSHTTLFVKNQDEALEFYTKKLGFEVRMDAKEGEFRWLTIGLKAQPDLEIILLEPKVSPMFDEESVRHLRALLDKGVLGAGAFYVEDCRATYEEYKKRGVEFAGPPKEQFYGIEAILKDNSGNWFSMTQPTKK